MNIILNNLQKLWLKEIGILDIYLNNDENLNKFKEKKENNNLDPISKIIHVKNKESNFIENQINNLKKDVLSCIKCNLHKYRKNVVFGDGFFHKPEVLVIGEAPGENEDILGLPFVGKSGQLLKAMLETIDLNKNNNLFISNLIKCRPPGNRNPNIEEINSCIGYITNQINIIKPKKILALGRFAAQNILNTSDSITKLRGKIHSYRLYDKAYPLVVTFHPSYLLRYPKEKALALEDILLLSNIKV